MKHIRLTRGHVIGLALSAGVILGAALSAPARAANLDAQYEVRGGRVCVYIVKVVNTSCLSRGLNGALSISQTLTL
ncbi:MULTISPECIES: hypothetical protein [Klebsiella]|uniref:hypothetical protein n=1 Tax=Klebsiella TaxID=570 RepID=UPI001157F501|nr:hypothetical protein [Klebsiella pasteurii]QUE96833.1 hypothetical protein KCG39_01620 [Klebsiella pasteurii]